MKKQSLLGALLALAALAPGLHAAIPSVGWTNASSTGVFIQSIEAESGLITANMVNGGSNWLAAWGASGSPLGGGYVYSPDTSGSVDISFNPPYTGDYKVNAVVLCKSGQDKFNVGVTGTNDNNSKGTRLWKTTNSSAPQSLWVTDDSPGDQADTSGNARSWRFVKGTTYHLVFSPNQAQSALDQVNFYLDIDDLPAAAGTNTGTGLCGDYWNAPSPPPLTGSPVRSELDPQVNFNWGGGAPVVPTPQATIGADSFGVRWTGFIEAPYDGVYTIRTVSDDGVRVKLNGSASWNINDWTDHGSTNDDAYLTMTAGTKYAVTMEYYENSGSAVAILQWFCPGEIPSFTSIPAGRLYQCAAFATPVPTNTPVATNTPGAGASSTSTPTRTVTPTMTMVLTPVYQGLSPTSRLYSKEYIPFPVVSNSSVNFRDLSYPYLTAAGNQVAKNTARWRIELVDLSVTVGLDQVAVETRIGPYGVTCTSGYFDPDNYSALTTLTLPARPQNISTTYLWLDKASVPISERYDTMGDPRYVPYADMLSLTYTVAFPDNYNWFFKDETGSDYSDYNPFTPDAKFDDYNGGPNMDVAKGMRFWREGVALSTSIYTSMTGFSNYYIGTGGEIGGDSANKLSSGVICYNGPWGASGNSGKNEITGASTLVRSSTWYSAPWIGELWPDSSYGTDWAGSTSGVTYTTSATWGNLRNNQQGGVAYRDSWSNFAASPSQNFPTVKHINADPGCSTFMNGNGGSANFGHFYADGSTANWLYDSQVSANDYNFAIPSTFSIARPWGLNAGTSSPPESGVVAGNPYSANRFSLSVYSASTQTAGNTGFYDYGGVNSQRASAAVRGYWNNTVGWFLVNGLAPATQSGINFVASFALVSCLRTFHDAGAPANAADGVFNGKTIITTNNRIGTTSYRIEPIPRIEITDPSVGQDLSGYQAVNIKWRTRYARWDGLRYTENYPCIDDYTGPCTPLDPTKKGNPDLEWHSLTGTALVYNVIYSTNSGSTWFSCLTNNPAKPGEYMDTVDSISGGSSNYMNYSWNVAPLAVGTKLVRVECFRVNVPQHYAYHEISIKTKP